MAAAPLPPVPASVPAPAPLSQGARIIDTFIAPTKTFIDVRRSAQWWLPFLLMTLVGWGLVYVSAQKIGVQKMMENDIVSMDIVTKSTVTENVTVVEDYVV